ncbi:MAG: small ribosomal subunit Rsm22 family protein [Treponemataceae bacterium]|nr:small ribosomal subunit Rsm22 family protein [Treponemataceae bacterium]
MGKNAQPNKTAFFQRTTIQWEGLCRAMWRAMGEPYQSPQFAGERRAPMDKTDFLYSLRPPLGFPLRKEPLTLQELEAAKKALFTLQRGLTGERNLVGRSYMQKRGLLGSYLLFYWFISRAQVEGMLNMAEESWAIKKETLPPRIIGEVSPHEPMRILDLGAGPAPCSIAVADWLRSRKIQSPIHITACDPSREAVQMGAFLAHQAGYTYEAVPFWKAGENPLPQGQYDVIILGHILNELWTDREDRLDVRFNFLRSIYPLLKEGGLLVILEPATLVSSREALILRDRLLTIRDLEIRAPCFYTASCPALGSLNQTCHSHFRSFLPPTTRILAQKIGVDKEVVKTTGFVFQKRKEQGSAITFPSIRQGESRCRSSLDSPAMVKHMTLGGNLSWPNPSRDSLFLLEEGPLTLSLLEFQNNTKSLLAGGEASFHPQGDSPTLFGPFRVVSEPMLNKAGRTRFILCGPSGRVAFSAKKGEGYPAEKQFFSLDRSDSLFILKPIEREQGLAVGPETKILPIVNNAL